MEELKQVVGILFIIVWTKYVVIPYIKKIKDTRPKNE